VRCYDNVTNSGSQLSNTVWHSSALVSVPPPIGIDKGGRAYVVKLLDSKHTVSDLR
jgi:DNA-binding beta-propeller fold protein YncE